MSTTTNHKRTRIIALVTALLVVAGVLGLAPKMALAADATHGDLVVTKTFNGGDGTEEAEFTVAIADGSTATFPTTYTITGKNPETIQPGSSSVTFKLKTGESATFTDVAPGALTVSEAAMEGFTISEVKATKGNQALPEVTSLPATVEISAKESTDVEVTNKKDTPTPEVGNLTISKTIGEDTPDSHKEDEFNFTVTRTKGDQQDTNEYTCEGTDRKTVKSGEAFPLKGGQTITIKDIPVDTTYKVEETTLPTGWTNTKKDHETGDITTAGATAAFTNTYSTTPAGNGTLKIAKTVSLPETEKAISEAEAGSSTREKLEDRLKQAQGELFTFTVTLKDSSDKALTEEYEYTGTLAGKDVTGKIKDGGTVSLAHGDAITINGLPNGTKYIVAENKAANWKVDNESKDGTISSNGPSEASFTNTALGALKISKTIKSASGTELSDDLKATDFTFTVTFTKDDEPVSGEFSYDGSKSGSIESGGTVTLKGGESVTFTDLPVGIKARVEETPVDYWQASAKALSGETVEYAARTATFTNTYQDGTSGGSSNSGTRTSGTTTTSRTATPSTADDTNVAAPVVLGALALGLVVVGRVARSKE